MAMSAHSVPVETVRKGIPPMMGKDGGETDRHGSLSPHMNTRTLGESWRRMWNGRREVLLFSEALTTFEGG